MDWLYERKGTIEAQLARRHLHNGVWVIYDLSCSQMEGTLCRLASYGCLRDRKPGKIQINCGLMTDVGGRQIKGDLISCQLETLAHS